MILWPDPVLASRNRLRELLASSGRPEAVGATVSSKDRAKTTGAAPVPYVQVRLDGTFEDSRLNGRASVRFVVYGRDEDATSKLARLVSALLQADGSSPELRGFSHLSGPIPAEDPDTGEPLSALVLTARLRPAQL